MRYEYRGGMTRSIPHTKSKDAVTAVNLNEFYVHCLEVVTGFHRNHLKLQGHKVPR